MVEGSDGICRRLQSLTDKGHVVKGSVDICRRLQSLAARKASEIKSNLVLQNEELMDQVQRRQHLG